MTFPLLELAERPLPRRQEPLFIEISREDRPWKVVRKVSRQVYAHLRDSGQIAKRTKQVITALAYYRNSRQEWPTAAELARFMFQHDRIERDDARLVAPRLTELLKGRVVRLVDGSKARKGGGVLTLGPVRTCRVTGARAHSVQIREAGSSAREAA